MEEKVRCKSCGKVGLLNDNKSLRRHLRLTHNTIVSKDYCIDDYFEPASTDAPVELLSDTRKAYKKKKNKKWTKWNRTSTNKDFTPLPLHIIYTPMGNKR